MIVVSMLCFAMATTAQDSAAPPTPAMDTGDGFSVVVSVPMFFSSLLFSVIALLYQQTWKTIVYNNLGAEEEIASTDSL